MAPELEQIRREVELISQGWTEDEWHRALPGKWTVAQILEHLLLTYTGTTKGLRRVINAGKVPQRTTTLPTRARKFLVTRFGYMPRGRSAFAQIMPNNGLSTDGMRHFYDALVAMDATLYDAERRFGKRAMLLDHPFLGPLRAQEWRLFHRTHSRHHLRQIEESVCAGGSPAERQVSA